MKINENGRSMIEMLGVLAIIGVLSVGGIAGYSKAMSKYRSNKVIDQATLLITNIRTMFAQQQTYAGLNNSRAVNLQIVPEEMIMSPETEIPDSGDRILRNVFSGEVSILPSVIKNGDTNSGAFKVTYTGLSRDACMAIATSDWGAGTSSGLVGLHIWDMESTAATTNYDDKDVEKVYKNDPQGGPNIAVPGDSYYRVPFTVIQAQAACSCKSKNTCAVTWKYF